MTDTISLQCWKCDMPVSYDALRVRFAERQESDFQFTCTSCGELIDVAVTVTPSFYLSEPGA